MKKEPLLKLKNVSKEFIVETNPLKRILGHGSTLQAVNEFSLDLNKGEVVGLVGESGCGKSTVALLILQLLKANSGKILFQGDDVSLYSSAEKKEFCKRVQMVFQDSHSALNPRKTIRQTLQEALRICYGRNNDLDKKAVTLMERTGLGVEGLPRYPHALSGGQRQRVCIARAMAMEPELIIADEPVSALDVSLQAQIINIFKSLRDDHGLTLMFISHDLALVNHLCNRIVVMYAGHIAETGTVKEVMKAPAHPYSQALIKSVPQGIKGRNKSRQVLKGNVEARGKGCLFANRCPQVMQICHKSPPRIKNLSKTHRAACHLLER